MYQSNIYEYLKFRDNEASKPLLLLAKDDKEAQSVADVASISGYTPYLLPDIRAAVGEDLRAYQIEIYALFSTLSNYFRNDGNKLLISPVRTMLLPLPRRELFGRKRLEFGETISLNDFKELLFCWGFHFVDIASQQGEVSFRGDIIDIYPIDAEQPYRISLFDEEIESIRRYDENSQKSFVEELEELMIIPTYLALDEKQYEGWRHRAEGSRYDTFVKDIDSLGLWHLDELSEVYFPLFETLGVSDLGEEIEEIYSLQKPYIERESIPDRYLPDARYYRDLEVIKPNALLKSHQDKKITVIARNRSIVRGSDLESFDGVEFVYQEGIVNILGPDHLIISLNKPIKKKRVKKASIILDELKPGDYVVHENHGVGLFRAIEKRDVLGATREFVVIQYQSEDTLLVPVENLEVIDRYVAEGGALPALDRLGKASFKRLKGKVREKLFAIASQIVNLSAQRHLQRGIILKSDMEEQALFMADAGFVHTEDQEQAIRDMLEDMSSGRMMDRLLSADVGFGKTEVAMNGIFAAVKSGYQAMMVAPTTLLSSQHYKSLRERLEKYHITIAKLDRFTTAKERKVILRGLEEGSIDMVVGTHALLKVKFAKLAFVIIDEEHKFGVRQKEALKEISVNVHLLSMSATPIPRSLNLALSHIKTFSEILTPPTERQGIRTFVKNFDEKVIKEAILRERRRGGQIFYVYNSIAGIEEKRREIKTLLPDLRITVLHSKISAAQTEKEMELFEEGKYDLLLSTSIVESGIHMPHANTMIVDGADHFGIADLHQLRGRVGRGGRGGYCYFIVEDKNHLTENAKRRLLALESHSDLGSGAVLAFHDLEIRGGGNIIGEAQSGHIKQIGYSLYLRMLEDAIRELSGQKAEEEKRVDINLSVNAYLSEEIINEDRLRLELYRRLSQCDTVGEVHEIEIEIEDRFGKLDTPTRQFIDIIAIKVLAKDQNISKVSSYEQNVFVEFLQEGKERLVLKSPSKDDDDLIATAMKYLKKRGRGSEELE